MKTSVQDSLARRERHGLAADLLRIGEDQPTLCEGWQTQDLVEHLYAREQRTFALIGSMLPWETAKEHYAKVSAEFNSLSWANRVDKFQHPCSVPLLIPGFDKFINTAEYFVHREDVLRAQPDWEVRELSRSDQLQLWAPLKRMAPLLVKEEHDTVLISPTSGGLKIKAKTKGGAKAPTKRVYGPASELLLWAFGRTGVAQVKIEQS